jgi:hypothetical protein
LAADHASGQAEAPDHHRPGGGFRNYRDVNQAEADLSHILEVDRREQSDLGDQLPVDRPGAEEILAIAAQCEVLIEDVPELVVEASRCRRPTS